MSLDLYTRQCSLGITAKQLSVAAATVANLGLNPVTKKQVFDAELSPKITSMISTVGFMNTPVIGCTLPVFPQKLA